MGAKGLRLGAHRGYTDASPVDVLIHPGGAGKQLLMEDMDYLHWLVETAETASIISSVCTGAHVLAAGGLIADRVVTSHWQHLDSLQRIEPSSVVRGDRRVVDCGGLVTAAGVSAGIDLGLYLVSRLAGVSRAETVREAIQYEHPLIQAASACVELPVGEKSTAAVTMRPKGGR